MSEFELRCYGQSEQSLRNQYASYIKLAGTEMFVMGILSDCQEMLEHGQDKDTIRKTLNKAKFFLAEKMEKDRQLEVTHD